MMANKDFSLKCVAAPVRPLLTKLYVCPSIEICASCRCFFILRLVNDHTSCPANQIATCSSVCWVQYVLVLYISSSHTHTHKCTQILFKLAFGCCYCRSCQRCRQHQWWQLKCNLDKSVKFFSLTIYWFVVVLLFVFVFGVVGVYIPTYLLLVWFPFYRFQAANWNWCFPYLFIFTPSSVEQIRNERASEIRTWISFVVRRSSVDLLDSRFD